MPTNGRIKNLFGGASEAGNEDGERGERRVGSLRDLHLLLTTVAAALDRKAATNESSEGKIQ